MFLLETVSQIGEIMGANQMKKTNYKLSTSGSSLEPAFDTGV